MDRTTKLETQVCLDITTILQSISKTEQKTWPPRGGKTNKTRSFATKLQGRSKTEKSESNTGSLYSLNRQKSVSLTSLPKIVLEEYDENGELKNTRELSTDCKRNFANKLKRRSQKEKSWKVTWPETTFEVTGSNDAKTKKVSSKRRESLIVHDIHDELADSEDFSTKKVSFEDISNRSAETEKSGVKKVSSERRESVVVHDIHDRLADSQELSTKKLSFEDNSKGSVETEKPGPKKDSTERRESVVVHDIHDKLRFEGNFTGSIETEKSGPKKISTGRFETIAVLDDNENLESNPRRKISFSDDTICFLDDTQEGLQTEKYRNDSGSSNSSSVIVHDDQKVLEKAKDSPPKKRNFANKLHRRQQDEKSRTNTKVEFLKSNLNTAPNIGQFIVERDESVELHEGTRGTDDFEKVQNTLFSLKAREESVQEKIVQAEDTLEKANCEMSGIKYNLDNQVRENILLDRIQTLEDKLLSKIEEKFQLSELLQKINRLEAKNEILANSQKALEEKLQPKNENIDPQIAGLMQKIGQLEAKNENLVNSQNSASSLNVILSLSFSMLLIASTVYTEFFSVK